MRNYAKRWSLAAEASKNLLNAATAPTHWIAAVSAAEEKSHAEPRRMFAKF